jgi:eukaryotic-like serine/threonine-protein kinase
MQNYWLPAIKAAIELSRGNGRRAVEALQVTAVYEFGSSAPGLGLTYPIYVRGQALLQSHQGTEAAREFQKILDHRGVALNSPIGSLAYLWLARANALNVADSATARGKARAAYQDFLTLWKDADPDIPILKEAKAEYAKL